MVPKISFGMIQDCLAYVTTMWFAENNYPPDFLIEYDSYIEDMKRYANKKGNLLYLRLGIEYILTNKQLDESIYEKLSGECWDFDKDEIIEILTHIYSVIWFEKKEPVFTGVPRVDLIKMSNISSSLADWELNKLEYNLGFDESKIEYITQIK